MNAPSSANPVPHDELPLPYRIAVEAILAEPPPQVDLEHLIPHQSALTVAAHDRRRWITRVCGASLAGAAAVVLIVSWLTIQSGDAWAQVVEAVHKQTWVRMQAVAPNDAARIEIWLSPVKRVAAGRLAGSAVFLDLGQSRFERFDRQHNTIYISEPGAADRDEFVALSAVLDSFASGQKPRQSKAQSVRLLNQSTAQGGAGDDRWTDFVLEYEDARRQPPHFRRVFRVPEGAKLPTSMTEEWTFDGKTGSRSYQIDYPADGPADLFALDVPHSAKVVDTRPGEALKSLLAAYQQQRAMALEPYSATVLVTLNDFQQLTEAYQVRFDGMVVSVRAADGLQLSDFNQRIVNGEIRMPDGADRVAWWKDQVAKLVFHAIPTSTGVFVPHQVNYPLLGLPNDKVVAILNPLPTIGPADCQLLTVDDAAVGDRCYWLDAKRGSMVVRSEHSSVENPTEWIATTIVDTAEESPRGHWYPIQVRRGQVERSGDDLRADAGVAPVATQVYRYLIDFE